MAWRRYVRRVLERRQRRHEPSAGDGHSNNVCEDEPVPSTAEPDPSIAEPIPFVSEHVLLVGEPVLSLRDYEYEPLPNDRSIRLLRILPKPTSILGHPWYIALKTVDLDSDVQFTALSYTWGSAIMSDEDLKIRGVPERLMFRYRHVGYQLSESETHVGVELDSCRFSITKNLFDFLDEQHRQKVDDDHLPKWLWIDAVCINQTDVQERNTQVGMMGDIYSAARHVQIWLGKNNTDLNSVLEIVEGPIYDKMMTASTVNQSNIGHFRDTVYLRSIGLEYTQQDWDLLWYDFFRFFERRRYFYRAWVFQECALSCHLIIICGSSSFEFRRLAALWQSLDDGRWKIQTAFGELGGLYSSVHMILRVGSKHQVSLEKSRQYPDDNLYRIPQHIWYGYLSYLISRVRIADSQDDRDKIFAIIGLANRVSPQRKLVSDYSMDVHELYIRVSSDMLLNRPGLITLYHREDDAEPLSRRNGLLPSWVPDFAKANRKRAPYLGKYNASDTILDLNKFSPSITDTVLTVSGGEFDQLVGVSDETAQAVTPCIEMRRCMADVYAHTGEPSGEAVWRTIIKDAWWDSGTGIEMPAPNRIEQNFLAWAIRECEKISAFTCADFKNLYLGDFPNLDQGEGGDIQSLSQSNPIANQKAALFLAAISYARSSRQRLFITSKGCIGLGSIDIREGDKVFLLMGARTPFILREIPGSSNYCFVNYAYVHGYMQGEMFKAVKDKLGPVHIA